MNQTIGKPKFIIIKLTEKPTLTKQKTKVEVDQTLNEVS